MNGTNRTWQNPPNQILGIDRGYLQNLLLQNSMGLVLLGLIIAATIASDGVFIQPSNLVTVLFQTSVLGVLAIGQTFAMLTGGIDLSIASLTVLSAIVIGATSSQEQDILPYLGVAPAFVVGLLTGTLSGFANGVIIVKTRIPPFIVTLATLLVFSSFSLLITDGAPVYYPASFFEEFGGSKALGVPYPVFAWLALTIIAGLFLSKTRFGEMIYGLGDNEHAARLAGLPTQRTKVLVYTLSGLMAGFAGFLFLARTGYASPSIGGDFLLDSIAVVVVGGVSLSGGQGSIKDALLGVLILATLSNLMNILLISPYIQSAVEGAIILVAVMINIRLAERR